LKVRELLRLLKKDGWEIDRIRGSLRQHVHATSPGIVAVSGHPNDDVHPKNIEKCAAASRFGGRTMKEYTVIYEWGKRNWSAYVPDLPGCIATGKTRKQVELQIREAIEFHIEGLKARGDKIPEPSIEAGTITVGA
jgi:predicted RNase H-like HicB family nuclease/predicted RNA binding protein YcfA (HicA-like mRNA interferase family)